jgi:lipid II:glycine glycyltransferase (peptidoglycan interpeptide bridge formation enzyme)
MLHKIPFTNYKIGTFIKGSMPTKKMLEELKALAKDENIVFIKIEPNYVVKKGGIKCADKKKVISMFEKVGAVPGKTLFTPTSFWIDLTKSEDELMKSFSSKTRYNIRLAKRKGVEIVEDNSKKAFEKYIELTRETVERQGFYAHTEKYHRLMWKNLNEKLIINNEKPIARLLIAKYKGEIIATWTVFVWKDYLYYPYGASSNKYKNVMANNLIMWEAIRYGKKMGLKTFDLWGREPGKGFTRFKEGYNPQVVEFLGTWDLVTSPLYYPYRVAEAIRWPLLRVKSNLVKPTF